MPPMGEWDFAGTRRDASRLVANFSAVATLLAVDVREVPHSEEEVALPTDVDDFHLSDPETLSSLHDRHVAEGTNIIKEEPPGAGLSRLEVRCRIDILEVREVTDGSDKRDTTRRNESDRKKKSQKNVSHVILPISAPEQG